MPATSSVWGFGEPQDGGRGRNDSGVPGNRCGPSSLPLSTQSQARARPEQQLWAEVGAPQTPRPSMSPRDARAGFLGWGTLGPEPGTPPPSIGWPPFRAEPRALLGAETKSSRICLLGRLFVPSAWKASQRGPRPSPPETRREEELRAQWVAPPLGLGASSCAEGVGVGRAGGRDPGTEGCSVGPRNGGDHCVHGPSGRIGEGRRSSPSARLRNLAVRSARALPAEGAAQSLSAAPSGFSPPAKSFVWKGTVSSAVVCLLLPPTSTPSANCPFFPSLFSPPWMGNHRLQLPSALRGVAAPFLCLRPLPAADWPLPPNLAGTPRPLPSGVT